ncbi:MAG TPA: hypothetical protein VK629_03205, partial [Steroidobacteraceae bacterium]|nr:hypothetical protein [Steroidobacteraceae bacterium]
SAIPFIGVVVLIGLLPWLYETRSSSASTWQRTIGHALVAAVAACVGLIPWYGLGIAPLSPQIALPVPVGIPGFIDSLQALLLHNNDGHLSYFMGDLQRNGWWNFYLVGLSVKTPLPLLIGALAGSVWLIRVAYRTGRWRQASPVLAAASVLVFCVLYSHINIGIRHVLLLFPLFAIIAAALAMWLWRKALPNSRRAAVCTALLALGGWQIFEIAHVQPDYIAYFNELAGDHPEKILIDSDLDWGQDLKRLKQALLDRHIDRVGIVYRGSADFDRENMPATFTRLWPNQRATGWVAVFLLAKATDESGGYRWLDQFRPIARIGKSVDLYFIMPPASP